MHRADSNRSGRPAIPLSIKKPIEVIDESYDRYDPDLKLPTRPPKPTNDRRSKDITREGYGAFDPNGRHHPHGGISPPSAAARARRNEYAPQRPGGPSRYGADSSSPGHGPSAGLKTKGVRLPKEAYQTGMIVRAAIHEPNLDQISRSTITVNDRTVTETAYGLVTSKMRKLIIIALHEDHYIAVPLYTHNGHGLTRKFKPNEYISVRDHRRRGPFTALSVHKPLVTEHLNTDIALFDPVTTAHITYPVSRPYILPVIHEGSLEHESTQGLLDLIGTSKFNFKS